MMTGKGVKPLKMAKSPTLMINAHIDAYDRPEPINDKEWVKEDIARGEKKVAGIKKALKSWDDKKVAQEAFRSLSDELEMELQYLAERRASLKRKQRRVAKGIKL